MIAKRMTGPEAGALKYDVLTALGLLGLAEGPVMQCSALRLVAAVTARYNWAADELSVGQRDLARIWACNERTVKREIKRLIETGLLQRTRPGVRGRVAAYRLDRDVLWKRSAPYWDSVGPDYAQRMSARAKPVPSTVVRVDFTSPARTEPAPRPSQTNTRFAPVHQQLKAEHPALYSAWYEKLELKELTGGVLRLAAPNRFVQRYVETHLMAPLVAAVASEIGPVDRIEFTI